MIEFKEGSFTLDDLKELIEVMDKAPRPKGGMFVDVVIDGQLRRMTAEDAWNYLYPPKNNIDL